jgi:prepilin-type N-terminal cleavage/methylation domain-containing protein
MKKARLGFTQLGFTLVELLIVISIIGILSTVVMINFEKTRSKSRDLKRTTDISQVQVALALYLNKYGKYPVGPGNTAGTWSVLDNALVQADRFLPELPSDPINGTRGGVVYKYGYKTIDTNSLGGGYCLSAVFENPSTYIDATITCSTDVADPPGGAANAYLYKVRK